MQKISDAFKNLYNDKQECMNCDTIGTYNIGAVFLCYDCARTAIAIAEIEILNAE